MATYITKLVFFNDDGGIKISSERQLHLLRSSYLMRMAVDHAHENTSPSEISPRISFSHDLCVPDAVPLGEPHPSPWSPSGSIDFDFCTRTGSDVEASSADELFSDGKILPTEVKRKPPTRQTTYLSNTPHPARPLDDDVYCFDENPRKDGDPEKTNSKSFWGFTRSSSLNCGSSYGRTLCPLPLLSRSNSTGSTPPAKRSAIFRGSKAQPQPAPGCGHVKPPLKRSANVHAYGNVVRVNPVINVTAGNLFCLNSIFFGGKERSSKKR